MSIDFNQTGCLSSPDSSRGREGNEHQAQTLQRPSDGVSSPPFGRRYDGCWTFSNLPPEIINHIFGFWLGSVVDVCTARSISLGINDSLLSSIYSSPYKIFMQTMRLTLDESNYHDSAMTIELLREKDGLRHSLNLNKFDYDKRSFFIHIMKDRRHRIARDQIEMMNGPYLQLKALMKLQRLLPRTETLAHAKDLLSQISEDKYDYALMEVLKTYPNQKIFEDQQEKVIRLFDYMKTGKLCSLCRQLDPDILDIFINTISITDLKGWLDGLVQSHSGGFNPQEALLIPPGQIARLFVDLIRSYLRIERIAEAQEFLNLDFSLFSALLKSDLRLHANTMLELMDEFLQIKELRVAESLLSQITEPFAKAYSQMKMAIAKKSLDELEEAKNLLMHANSIERERLSSKEARLMEQEENDFELPRGGFVSNQREMPFEEDSIRVDLANEWLTMKIVQAFLMLNDLDGAKEFLSLLEPYLQFQAQLEILKACQSQEEFKKEFDFARDLALSMNEKKDILLMQLITEYLKTDGQEKLSRAIEVRNLITDPYYKIKVQIQIIKASEREEDYSTAKTEMNEFMESLGLKAESRGYWMQMQSERVKLNFFQEMIMDQFEQIEKIAGQRKYLERSFLEWEREPMQGLQESLKQELQEELMNAYIQKEDFVSARGVSLGMIIDKLQCRDNCILNLIDELLKRERISEAKNLLQLEGSSLFKALVQIKIAKASLDDKWEEELSKAIALIDKIPKVEPDYSSEVENLSLCLWKKETSNYKSEVYNGEDGLDISESVDGYVFATQNLIGACIERKDLETAKELLSKISPLIRPEETVSFAEGSGRLAMGLAGSFRVGGDDMVQFFLQEQMQAQMRRAQAIQAGLLPPQLDMSNFMPGPGEAPPFAGPAGLDAQPPQFFDMSNFMPGPGEASPFVGPAGLDASLSQFDFPLLPVESDESDDEEEMRPMIEPGGERNIMSEIVGDMSDIKRNLFDKFLKSKEFQSAETLLGLISNPKLKFEALTRLIEAMFKRDA